VVLKPKNPQVVLVATELAGKIYCSEDGGNSWSLVFTLPGVVSGDPYTAMGFKRMVFSPASENLVYAGTCRGVNLLNPTQSTAKGVYRSPDGGLTWESAYAPSANIADKCIHDLALHPTLPGIIYAATYTDGLYRTGDGGASWNKLSLPANDVRSVAIRPDQPNVVYAGTQGQGVYVSVNDGANWTPSVNGMEPNDQIWSIVFDPVNPDVVWAGSYLKGVYRWDSAQAKWALQNDGLDMRAVTWLEISSDGSVLYANTWGGGVYRLGDPSFVVYLPIVHR
jgi:hypothetical protein